MEDVWTYRDRSSLGSNVVETKTDLSGFKVEALDGSIGSIDEATYGTTRATSSSTPARGSSARRSAFPAGVIRGIDTDDERVFVNRTKDEIKSAPEFDDAMLNDDTYYSSVGSYYGRVARATAAGTTASRPALRQGPAARACGRRPCRIRRTGGYADARVLSSTISRPSARAKNARAKGELFVLRATLFQFTCSRTRARSRAPRGSRAPAR